MADIFFQRDSSMAYFLKDTTKLRVHTSSHFISGLFARSSQSKWLDTLWQFTGGFGFSRIIL